MTSLEIVDIAALSGFCLGLKGSASSSNTTGTGVLPRARHHRRRLWTSRNQLPLVPPQAPPQAATAPCAPAAAASWHQQQQRGVVYVVVATLRRSTGRDRLVAPRVTGVTRAFLLWGLCCAPPTAGEATQSPPAAPKRSGSSTVWRGIPPPTRAAEEEATAQSPSLHDGCAATALLAPRRPAGPLLFVRRSSAAAA